MSTSPSSASPWMKHLERAHGLAHAAARVIEEESEPSAHLAPAARKIERGVAAMYDAFDGRADRLTALSLAHARLWDGAVLVAKAGLTRALAPLREACSALVDAEERFPRVPMAERAPTQLRAGAELLRLHTVERASLSPSFRAPPLPAPTVEDPLPELPEPTTFEELAAAAAAVKKLVDDRAKALIARAAKPRVAPAAPPPAGVPEGFAIAPRGRIAEDEFVRRWARECVEEVGMLGLQRTPLRGDDWRACRALDRRLVAAVDALAALGPIAIASVEPLVLDAPVADPMRMFAMALIGGCLEGRDALAGAERALHRFGPGDPPIAAAFVSALKLAQSPFTGDVLRALLASKDKACRAIAVEALAYRGWLTTEELAALVDDEDPRLLALALPALGAARHPDLRRALARALAGDLPLQEAALDAMALCAHGDAAAAARSAAAGALGDRALVRLAIVADEDDARWLLDRAGTTPTPAAIEALGWAGSLAAVPLLLKQLASEDEDAKLAAGAALDRLLGAKLIDQIEIMPEAIDDTAVADPDPEGRPPRLPLAEMVGDKRHLPPPGSPEKLEVPSIDPERWRAYWIEHGSALDPKKRHRRGQAYSPSISLYELDQLPLSADDRRRLHRELAARTGKLTAFDPHDFVAAQEQSLKAWEGIVRSSMAVPGGWSRPIGR